MKVRGLHRKMGQKLISSVLALVPSIKIEPVSNDLPTPGNDRRCVR